MNACRGVVTLILNFDIKLRWVVNFTHRPLYSGKVSHWPLNRRGWGGGGVAVFACWRRKKISCSCRNSNPGTSQTGLLSVKTIFVFWVQVCVLKLHSSTSVWCVNSLMMASVYGRNMSSPVQQQIFVFTVIEHISMYNVVQIWPGQTVTCLHTISPGHIWTTL
jgi:hypothetical protein